MAKKQRKQERRQADWRRIVVAALAGALALLMLLPMFTMILGSAGAVTQAEIDALKRSQAESKARQRELEEQLAPRDFVRVSKSAIVNFDQVRSLRPDLGGRLRLTLSNGEVVVANRQYVPAIKQKLGL